MRVVIFIYILVYSIIGFAQTSPFNGKVVKVDDENNFSFIVGGHFHGASTNTSGFPAATLLGNLDRINSKKPAFIASLGDLFLSPSKDMRNYPRTLFNKLNCPIFNAVGNHDVEDFDYEKSFGSTIMSWEIGSTGFVILDTERDNGDFGEEQLSLIRKMDRPEIKNLFIFAHRPVWTENDEALEDVFKGNTSHGTDFDETILPLVKRLKAKVYIFGGSIGGEAPVSFFYHEKTDRIVYIANAIRNLPRDGVLNVEVRNGKITFTPLSLTGQNLKNLESYDLNYWQNNVISKSFNWRLLPMYILRTFTNWLFWVGCLFAILSGGFVYLIRRWWKRRKKA